MLQELFKCSLKAIGSLWNSFDYKSSGITFDLTVREERQPKSLIVNCIKVLSHTCLFPGNIMGN